MNTQKIENFFKKELSSNLTEVFIVKNNDETYELFNRYRIETQKNGLHKVIPYTLTEERIFSSLKYAFVWCIFNKLKKYTESKRIEQIDHMLDSLNISILQQKKLLSKAKDNQTKHIYMAKIHESKIRKNVLLKELKTYINISRHWQYSKFLKNNRNN